ncbi:dynamin family protein [Vreelandella glaciei]|uniref:dynamin family protein n=1 Tax=Vreelandella glaciei TaxID=186761 RepID=UPI0030EC6851|tara:strand:- start:31407 stop:33695 length:2289 start_codon:yes stop_codon:yes gene_type:complete
MLRDQLIQRTRKLEDILARNTSSIGIEAASLRAEHSMESADSLEKAFTSIEEQERLMQVGIIGRVKAGKSSLLNALFFGGKSVLPKAATPMTAALTTITYGEELSAVVEFYSKDDLEAIRNQAEEYDKRFNEEYVVVKKKLEYDECRHQQWPSQAGAMEITLSSEAIEKINKKATRLARNAMQSSEVLTAAYDQYSRIRSAGLERANTSNSARLKANDLEGLKAVLGDYVGADGPYMPITKSVHMQVPLEGLKNIRVIDTPGLNDPIASRERRTNELLMHCDVVFIVSPAGQCLNVTDIDLMGRISVKEGVHELYLVASQVDNALFGSDIKKPNIEDALNDVTSSLGRHAVDTLRQLRQESPEVGNTFDPLIQQPEERIVSVSGMAHALSQKLGDRDNWDSSEKTAWNNLAKHYPNQFNQLQSEDTKYQLESLGNISRLEELLENARGQKEAILEKRSDNLVRAKSQTLCRFLDALLNYARENQTSLRLTDISQLNSQKLELTNMKTALAERMRNDFEEVRVELTENMAANLTETLETLYEIASEKQENVRRTIEQTNEVDKAGLAFIAKLWGGGTKFNTETVTVLNTAPAASNISKYLNSVSQKILESAKKTRNEWRRSLYKVLVESYRNTVGDEQVDITLARQAINNVVYSIPVKEFEIDTKMPNILRPRGRIKGNEAELYYDEAGRFLANLKIRLDECIREYIHSLESSLPTDISSSFYKSLDERIERLRNDIENKAESLDRLARLVNDLEEVRNSWAS